jgi:hypothetical protein
MLGRRLLAEGWAVRGTSRGAAGIEAIRDAGIEPASADPDRAGTIVGLVGDVTVVAWLMGSASGPDELIEAVNGPRLERVLEKLVDTPVRGFVHERRGAVGEEVLARGAAIVADAAERWQIPVGAIDADPVDYEAWVEAATTAIRGSIAPPSR